MIGLTDYDIIFALAIRRFNVMLQIRTGFRKTAILLILSGMIMGLFCPSASDSFYDNLIRLNNQTSKIDCVDSLVINDSITAGEADVHNQYRPIERSGNVRTDQFRLTDGDSFCTSRAMVSIHFFIILLGAVLCSTVLSYRHILFIHLKDGHK